MSFKKHFLTAAAVSLVFVGMMSGGCSDGDGGAGGGELAGDWLAVSISTPSGGEEDISSDYSKFVLRLQSNQKASAVTLERISDDIWTEVTSEDDEDYKNITWSVSGGSLILTMKRGSVSQNIEFPYTISGNNLSGTFCDEDGCASATLTRINFADFKRSLGNVYKPDPKLYGDWELQGDDYGYIYFEGNNFGGGEIYIDASGGYYYTRGNTLYLIGEACDLDWDTWEYDCVTETVELTYSVSGSGKNRTLNINGDTWKIYDYDYYYGPAKSRHGKNPTKKGGGVPAPLSKLLDKPFVSN